MTLHDLAIVSATLLAMTVIGCGLAVGAYLIIHDRVTNGNPLKSQRTNR